ncbi:phospholipase A and acyltransferase 4-like [Sander lucioperca]|uniref:phospholipase A and acyltransferase 4-like n=1 Tax=Sander lucioperca TaxID=283035 RepID=UPI00125D8AFD|nr:phospholipase A and acyltransferase 4-like [Sander lucioperca]XP_031136329.1 phospholipase A and acyltransferase 4-like [Sander lucioperca]
MDPTEIDAKPGDLIEIDRGMYQHWALYIGGMEVVHLTTPNDDSSSSGSSLMALDIDVGQVKREKIWEVVGNDNVKVNNLLDYKHQPHESYIIVKEACSMVGLELPYSTFTRNCEHFVTDLRYGKPESRQVIKAAAIGVAAVGIVALGAALFASWLNDDNKEERREERREPRREPRRERRRHYNWQ